MSRHAMQRASLLIPLALAALAGCRDSTEPAVGPAPQFAQGDNGAWTVTSLADPGDGVCDDAECTLREAIAAGASGDKIGFASGLQGNLQLTAGELTIDGKILTIDGAGRITLDAQGNSRVMQVLGGGGGPSSDVSLIGLTLANGSAPTGDGAGLFIAGSVVLTLDGVTLSHNAAGARGGGAFLGGSQATIRNSTIADNTAGGDGGGLYVQLGTSVELRSSTVAGNEASSLGGGLFNATGATVTVDRSTISSNLAPAGAGILNTGGLALRSSTLVRNGGSSTPGGLVTVSGGSTTVANSIVAANVDEDCKGTGLVSLGHNLTIAGAGCPFTASGDVQVASSQVFTEVLEQQLTDNGGPTRTHALIPRGRAADAGYCPGETTDQRGFDRPMDDPVLSNARDACDIGAYELQGPVAAVADLMISQAVNKTSVKQGDLLTYSVRVQNLGPETAPDVVVTDLLPTGATFVDARHNKGAHTAPPKGETGTVTWYVGDLLDQANEVAEITVTVLVKGRTTITNTASVTGEVADPNEANNTAAIKVSVATGSGGKTGGGKK
jgi:uncharacterized repeat protein (TIGR01451 family)/CSLREA domain-containing protein